MLDLETQFLDGSLPTTLWQNEAEVSEGEIENERALEIARPATARKRTDHVTGETRTVLRDLDENVVTPKRKRRRKAGKKCTQVLSESQPAPTGEILLCVPHDKPTHDVSRTTERELLRSVNLMTDILKRLDDRTTALKKQVEQISSRLHEHIMACSREESVEIPPVTTPSVAALVDPLPPVPEMSNQVQADALSPSVTTSLPRPIATVNAKYIEVSSEEICRQELKTAQEVLQKYPDLHIESKIGVLAVKLARQAFFGDNLLKRCTPRGWQNMPALPQAELNMLKVTLFKQFPRFWSCPEEFEKKWAVAQEAIAQACKRLRQ